MNLKNFIIPLVLCLPASSIASPSKILRTLKKGVAPIEVRKLPGGGHEVTTHRYGSQYKLTALPNGRVKILQPVFSSKGKLTHYQTTYYSNNKKKTVRVLTSETQDGPLTLVAKYNGETKHSSLAGSRIKAGAAAVKRTLGIGATAAGTYILYKTIPLLPHLAELIEIKPIFNF